MWGYDDVMDRPEEWRFFGDIGLFLFFLFFYVLSCGSVSMCTCLHEFSFASVG